MKKLMFAALLFLLSQRSFAQNTQEAKIDTLLGLSKKIYQEVHNEPLANKTKGIEFNPARLLAYSANHALSLSGGLSLFNIDRRAEIAFPILYENDTKNNINYFSVDAHYRRFIGQHQNGFYLSAGVRYARIHGEEGGIFGSGSGQMITANKFGVMFGIGFRVFSRGGLYWGTSLSVGRYFTDTNKDIQHNDFTDTGKILIDSELLKFGIAF
jgi:hypothetical protein